MRILPVSTENNFALHTVLHGNVSFVLVLVNSKYLP